jgi:hypothetical protein
MVDLPGETGRYCTGGVILLGRGDSARADCGYGGKRLPDFAAGEMGGKGFIYGQGSAILILAKGEVAEGSHRRAGEGHGEAEAVSSLFRNVL